MWCVFVVLSWLQSPADGDPHPEQPAGALLPAELHSAQHLYSRWDGRLCQLVLQCTKSTRSWYDSLLCLFDCDAIEWSSSCDKVWIGLLKFRISGMLIQTCTLLRVMFWTGRFWKRLVRNLRCIWCCCGKGLWGKKKKKKALLIAYKINTGTLCPWCCVSVCSCWAAEGPGALPAS